MRSQIFRIPSKYKELFETISNEDCWKLIIALMNKNNEWLEWIILTYYNIIIVDIDNIENQVKKWQEWWKKWWRPRKEKTPPFLNEKPNISKDNISKDKINNNTFTKKQKEEEFNFLWKLYPRKEWKAKSLEIYLKNNIDYNLITFAIEKYKKENTDIKFIKHFSTFLNQKSYLDYEDDFKKLQLVKEQKKEIDDEKPNWELKHNFY